MKPRTTRSFLAAGATALILSATALPASANPGTATHTAPQNPAPTEQVAACNVTDATLQWGIIERWRAYIQGSIANGGWETHGNVTYDMPEFVWTEGEGIIAVTTDVGKVSFDGGIDFAGHSDLLQVSLANPTLELVDDEEAYLLLDLTSTDMEGNADTETTQERAVKLDIAGTADTDDNTVTFANVGGALTAEGAAAFGGFYAAGEEIDPLTVQITVEEGCTFVGASPVDPPAEEVAPEDAEDEVTPVGPASPERSLTLPLIVGGVALVVIVVATVMLITGRKKQGESARAEPSIEQPEDEA